jgi:hypothetical protein
LLFAVLTVCLLLAGASSAFGAGKPVEPGNAKPSQFIPAAECGCHSGLVEEWAASMHAQALTDPIYLAKLAQGEEATGGKLGAFCNKCHGPVATMTGEMGGTMSPASAESITCTFCHFAVGNQGKPGNTSQLVEADGVRRAQIKDPQAPHPAAYGEFQTKADICGGCHNVRHPVNGMHLESTYSEWLASPYAEQGVVCQDCHMSEAPGTIGPSKGVAAAGAPERDNIYRMTFVGGQVALGPSDLATARLKSAATVEMELAEIVAPGEETSLTVTITNSGAGHYLPTGLTEVRQMWLEVSAVDSAGTKTVIGEHKFGTELKDDKGNHPVELWDATGVYSDDRIPPQKSVTDSYTFKMPAGAEKSDVVAALYYKSAPDELAEKAKVENPVTEMASAKQVVYASNEAKVAEASRPTDEPAQGGLPWTTIIAVLVGMAVVAGAIYWWRTKSSAS